MRDAACCLSISLIRWPSLCYNLAVDTNDENNFDQGLLNQPLMSDAANDSENEAFLDLLVSLVKEGKIDLYKPASLINDPIYGRANEEARNKADFDAVQMMATVREIIELCDNGYRESFQVANLVERLRTTKMRLEEVGGDLFII